MNIHFRPVKHRVRCTHYLGFPTNTSGDRPFVGRVNPCFQGICEFFCFSVFQFFSFKAGGRPTCTADSLFHSTWCCMAPNQGRCNRKSDFSDTFELGRDAYREIVEQYLSRSSDSTTFSSSCNQVRRQPFCHCTEAPSSSSSVQSVYRLGLLW